MRAGMRSSGLSNRCKCRKGLFFTCRNYCIGNLSPADKLRVRVIGLYQGPCIIPDRVDCAGPALDEFPCQPSFNRLNLYKLSLILPGAPISVNGDTL